METEIVYKKHNKQYSCDFCNFSCCLKTDLERHLLRPKHKKNVENFEISGVKKSNNVDKKNINSHFICENCDRKYKERSGLWKHKKNGYCIKVNNPIENKIDVLLLSNIIIEIIKNNPELEKNVMELYVMK